MLERILRKLPGHDAVGNDPRNIGLGERGTARVCDPRRCRHRAMHLMVYSRRRRA